MIIFSLFLTLFNYIVVIYFLALNSIYLLTSILAFRSLRKYMHRLKSIDIEDLIAAVGAMPITLLAPAYNEEATCIEATKSLLSLNYPEYEILMINDGSKDRTLAVMTEAFDMIPAVRAPMAEVPTAMVRGMYRSQRYPNLWLLDKENGGKADTLNAGINYCRTPLFCAMDADSLLERDALIRVVRPFLEDSRTVAVGGVIRIVNGCTVDRGEVTSVNLPENWLARFQVVEYLRAFLSGRMGWDALGGATLIISGAFGVFKRSVVVAAGGYRVDTVGEDMELVVRMHRHCREKKIPYKISFVPDPVAWTECPESLKILGRQRDRWQRGLAEVLERHLKMLCNPRYGVIGMLAYPYFYFFEMYGPIIEFIGYITFVIALISGTASTAYIIAFLLVSFAFGIMLSAAAVGFEELTFRRYPRFYDLFWLYLFSVLENFGYRQMSTYWRFCGIMNHFLKVNKGWGKMERKGFGSSATPPPVANSAENQSS